MCGIWGAPKQARRHPSTCPWHVFDGQWPPVTVGGGVAARGRRKDQVPASPAQEDGTEGASSGDLSCPMPSEFNLTLHAHCAARAQRLFASSLHETFCPRRAVAATDTDVIIPCPPPRALPAPSSTGEIHVACALEHALDATGTEAHVHELLQAAGCSAPNMVGLPSTQPHAYPGGSAKRGSLQCLRFDGRC